VEAKCEVSFPLVKRDAKVVERLGLQGLSVTSACVRRVRKANKRILMINRWKLPPDGILKINTNGFSKGNLGPAGIGGIGGDSVGSVIFFFSAHEGMQTINMMEGLAILYALEKAYALGWKWIICESDSQVLINLLIKWKVLGVNWQLALIVQQILQVSLLMDMVTFVHIPCEWNRAADCSAKWASEHLDGGRTEEWELVPPVLHHDLERILDEDREGYGDGYLRSCLVLRFLLFPGLLALCSLCNAPFLFSIKFLPLGFFFLIILNVDCITYNFQSSDLTLYIIEFAL